MTDPEHILVLRPLGLGDFLTGVPALRALRDAYPAARITLAAPAALTPLARLSGAVDAVADSAPLQPLTAACHGAGLAVDLHGRGPESALVLLATAPRRLVAWDSGLPATRGFPRWRADEHEVARWCRLLTESGIPADPAPARLLLAPPGVPSPAPGAAVVHPGAAFPARRWPAGRWAAVARLLRADGHTVVVTGGPAERELAGQVAALAGLPAGSVLAGRTGLGELAALTAEAALVLSGDTGMAHLAAAYARPAVTLAGPVPPGEWGPPARPGHVTLWAGQRGDPHGLEPDPGLLRLTVPEVAAAVKRVLAGPPG